MFRCTWIDPDFTTEELIKQRLKVQIKPEQMIQFIDGTKTRHPPGDQRIYISLKYDTTQGMVNIQPSFNVILSLP